MATRICPTCGAQYVATVRRCIDCDVVLVEETSATAEAESVATPVGDGDQVGYELEGWGNQLKVTLEGMLDNAGIHRAWEAGALVVGAHDEEAVDDLIATLEGGDLVELDDETPRVALEIEGLDADGQAELDARLLADAVPHAWDDEGALVVAETDEERVLAIVDDVLDGPVDETDGLAATEALSDLFVAVDRLVKRPTDEATIASYREATTALEGLSVPYGFAAADWDDLVGEADRLAVRLGPVPVEDDDDATDDDAEHDDSGEEDGDDSTPEAAIASDAEVDDGDDAVEDDGDAVEDGDGDDEVEVEDDAVEDDGEGGSEEDDEGDEPLEVAVSRLRERLSGIV